MGLAVLEGIGDRSCMTRPMVSSMGAGGLFNPLGIGSGSGLPTGTLGRPNGS